jgi:probable addiction module antidote protein
MKKKKIEVTDFWKSMAADINTPKKMRDFIDGVNKAYDETKDPDVILTALRIIALVKGNVAKLAREAKVERRSVYNMFQKGSNPTLKNFAAVTSKLGLGIHLSYK